MLGDSPWEVGTADFLSFDFALSGPAGPIEEEADRVRDVVADFRLFVGSELIYRDVDFPVVELALALAGWAERVVHTGEPFSFDSRPPLLQSLFSIRRGMQGWHLTSIQRELPSSAVFPLERVLESVREFMVELERRVLAECGFSVRGMR